MGRSTRASAPEGWAWSSTPPHRSFEGAALKVIRPGLLDSPATRDRFRREVAILRSVHDDHISEFLAADLESDPAWLAIEYVSGPTLRDEVAERGALSEEDWWTLARGMAQALAVLEASRITHRDLKPSNVILGENGPQLIDFGIAHPEDATSLTATGLVTGSPAWLSPEQATMDPTGPSSDIFALGSLLAFAATARPPFGEGASVAVLMSIAMRDPDLVGIDPNRRRAPAADARQGPHPPADCRTGPRPAALHRRPDRRDARGSGRARGAGRRDDVDAYLGGRPAGRDPFRGADQPPMPTAPTAGAAALVSPAAVAGAHPAPPPARPRTAGTPRAVGPRTAAAQQRRANRRRWVVILLVGLALLLGGWLVVQALDDESGSGSEDSSSGAPASAADAPPAPAYDQLSAGDWLLETYRLDNTGSRARGVRDRAQPGRRERIGGSDHLDLPRAGVPRLGDHHASATCPPGRRCR